MEHVELTVLGEDAWTVPRAIRGFPEDNRFDYDGDGFAVILTEQFFYRINSSLQTTTIFELIDDSAVKVTLVSGGGAAGLAKDDLDAESTAVRKLVSDIENFCRQNDLEIER